MRIEPRYPTYVPAAGKATYALRVIADAADLRAAFRLRYRVFEALGYLPGRFPSGLEIDAYDGWSIPFGAFSLATGELCGTLRLVTGERRDRLARAIRRLVDASGDAQLRVRALSPRRRPLPSLISEAIGDALARANPHGRIAAELSRTIVHPDHRGSGLSRGLMELGLARAMLHGDRLLLGGCHPDHVALYARYGYRVLPGTGIDPYDSVGGQGSHTVVCDTAELPEPTRSRAARILAALRGGATGCLFEAHPSGRGLLHFAETISRRDDRQGASHGNARTSAR